MYEKGIPEQDPRSPKQSFFPKAESCIYHHKGQPLLSELNIKKYKTDNWEKIILQAQLHRCSFCWGFGFGNFVGFVGFSFQENRGSKANMLSGLHTRILINNYLSYAVTKTHICKP